MTNTDTDFKTFQKEFKKYQRLLGLTGYKVYFKYEPIDDFADITCTHADMIATVRLNNSLSETDLPFKNVLRSAKHEAIHLLLMRIEYLALERFIRADELKSAVEEVVIKLEKLLP